MRNPFRRLPRRDLSTEKRENQDLAQFFRHGFEREGFKCLTHKDHLTYHKDRCDWVWVGDKGRPK